MSWPWSWHAWDWADPVLIVNGFSLFPLYGLPTPRCRRVYRRQHRRVAKVNWALENMIDVVQYARAVRDNVHRLMDETNKNRVCLVGWSMGGIACLYALKRLAIDPWVEKFVAFGAPFSGADLSYLAMFTGIYSRVGSQLAPGSRFLAELNRNGLPEETACVSIGGRRDLICPPATAHLRGATNVVLDFAHGDFLASADLHREIASRLK